ncbi:MAG: TrkA C-terminal domain-containing protein, partial [Haloarculaceae archaeon]
MIPAASTLAPVALQTSALRAVARLVANLAGMGLLAALFAGLVALAYRWYVRERAPTGLAALAGLSAVAVYLNTTPVLGQVIGGSETVLEIEQALYNITAFVVAGGGSVLGARAGDRLGTDLFATTGTGGVDGDVSTIVQSVGRVISVELPEEIPDIVGYDPVPEATREKLAGRTFLFPRRLTVAELRERLVARLKTDYGVGHVDIEIAEDGSVEYLALGSRAAGIGPTLPPATSAVALRADPAHAASAGDLVQVWETDPMRRVLTGELRGVAGEVVTVAIDAADTPKIDPTQRYRLVTLPVEDRPEREFASLLRAADETMATITVEAGSSLDGVPVGALDLTVVAVTHENDRPDPLPSRDRLLAAGDVIYAIAAPDALRKAEAAARAPEGVEPASEPAELQDSPSEQADADGERSEGDAT